MSFQSLLNFVHYLRNNLNNWSSPNGHKSVFITLKIPNSKSSLHFIYQLYGQVGANINAKKILSASFGHYTASDILICMTRFNI